MDGLLYDLTEKQVYHIGRQVLLALVRQHEMTAVSGVASLWPNI